MNLIPILLSGAAALLAASAHAHSASGVHAASAAGYPADPAAARRVKIGMHDNMRFTPERLTVRRGETLRLDIANAGAILHELVLGTAAEIAGHREAMRRDPAMAHGAPNMVHVAPGGMESIVWQFTRQGELEFACLLPGHYEAGMRGSVSVQP